MFKLFLGVFIGLMTGFVFNHEPGNELHFSPKENLESIDVELISEAKTSIDMAAYVLTDDAVIGALDLAVVRGVKVRVYRDNNEAMSADKLVLFARGNAEQRFKPPGALMHLKAYCVDGKILRVGSANFSKNGLMKQNNEIEIDRRPWACEIFEDTFNRMWEEH